MPDQHPAANTSTKQCAAVIKKYVQDHAGTLTGKACLDFGAGRYHVAAGLLEAEGLRVYRVDKYWQTPEVNLSNFSRSIQDKDLQVIFCANVLNVCLEQRERLGVLKDLRAAHCAHEMGPEILISIYEKNRNGVPDSTQLNWPAAAYEVEILSIFPAGQYNVRRQGNTYRVSRGITNNSKEVLT